MIPFNPQVLCRCPEGDEKELTNKGILPQNEDFEKPEVNNKPINFSMSRSC
jgi:hypothetical protein